jgi:type I restriction enzyme R subunit
MHKEIDFENDIEHALTHGGGYENGAPGSYDPESTAGWPHEHRRI